MNRFTNIIKEEAAVAVFTVFLAIAPLNAQQTPAPSASDPISQTTAGSASTTPLTKDELKAQKKAHKQQEKAADANAKAAKSQAKAKKDQDKALQEQEKTAGTAPKD